MRKPEAVIGTEGDRSAEPTEASRHAALRSLQRLIARLNASRDLSETLQTVVEGVVDGLGFGVAAVNVVREDGRLEVAAAAGREEMREALLGQVGEREDWDAALAVGDAWGALRFLPHDRYSAASEALPDWIPDVPACADDTGAWHPLDALFAPLLATSGGLVGVLSVDLPADGRLPQPEQCELLEMYAAQAGIAIENAQLHDFLRRDREALRQSEEIFRQAFDNAPIGMAISDLRPGASGRYLRVNDALCAMLGYSREALMTLSFREITHPEDVARDIDAVAEARAGRLNVYQTEKRYLAADGTAIWVSVSASVIRGSDGSPLHWVTQFLDISERKKNEIRLVRQALHDPLTGLPNRLLLLERLEHAVASAHREGPPTVLLFCDLDDFKLINDAYGHAAGDALLIGLAARLAEELRSVDLAARLSGDEFVVLLENVDIDQALELTKRIVDRLREPVRHGDLSLTATMSIGIVPVDDTAPDALGVLHRADTAMYQAKRNGKNGYYVFHLPPAVKLHGVG